MRITKRQLRRIIREAMTNAKNIAQMLLSGNKMNIKQALMLAKNIGLIERRRSKDYWVAPGWGLGMLKELDVIIIDPELIHEISQWEKTLSRNFKVSYHWHWEIMSENKARLSFHVYDDSHDWGEDAKALRYDDTGKII